MRQFVLMIAVAIAAGVGACTPARAAVDQQQLLSNSNIIVTAFPALSNGATGLSVAQTFTVGITGQLTSIDVGFYNLDAANYGLRFLLLPVIGSLPDNNDAHALFSVDIAGSSIRTTAPTGPADFLHVTITGGIAVTAGQKFAFAMQGVAPGGAGRYLTTLRTGNPYAGGAMFYRGSGFSGIFPQPSWVDSVPGAVSTAGFDAQFQTNVSVVPESTSAALVAAGVLGLVAHRRRRRAGAGNIGRS